MLSLNITAEDFITSSPILILVVFGCFALIIEAFTKKQKDISQFIALIGLIVALITTTGIQKYLSINYQGMMIADGLTWGFTYVFLAAGILTVLLSNSMRKGAFEGEFYALLLFSTAGAIITASAGDLITLFLGIELLSIPLYVMVGYYRDSKTSSEAGMKYFLLGAFSSGFFLYGLALVYGATGTTNLISLHSAVMSGVVFSSNTLWIGIGMILVGLGFKIALAPLHMWAPDVYTGAPTPVTGFLATASKAAGFAAMIRLFIYALPNLHGKYYIGMMVLAVLTLVIGSVVALAQTDFKRLMAYSSIVHGGYLLVGVIAASPESLASIIFYLIIYTFMTIGVFAIIHILENQEKPIRKIEDFAGLSVRKPGIAAILAVILIALTGVPPTAGFMAKFYVFYSAILEGYYLLVLLALMASVISAYYYLRVIVLMYMRKPESDSKITNPVLCTGLVLVFAVAVILLMGVLPSPMMTFIKDLIANGFQTTLIQGREVLPM